MLAVPFLLFPSPSTVLALLIVPGLGIIFWLTEKHPFPRTPLNPAILLLAVMLLVSASITYDMKISLPKIAGLLLGIQVFFCYASYGATPRGWVACLLIFILAGLGVAVMGLIGTRWALKFNVFVPLTIQFEPLVTGLPGSENGINPNEVAGGLLWVIPILFALALTTANELRRTSIYRRWLAPINLLTWEAAIFVFLVFLLCQSRGAYLALATTAVGVVLWLLRNRVRWYLTVLLATGILVVGFTWQFQADPSTREALGTKNIAGVSLSAAALGGRDVIWVRALQGIEKYPLTGMGINVFRYQVNTLDPANPIYVDRDIAHAHNEFLQAALDLGLPGMIAFIALHVIAFRMLVQVWNWTARELKPDSSRPESFFLKPNVTRMLVLGLGLSPVAHLLYGLTDTVALGAKPGVLFWMLLGLIVGLYRQKESAMHVNPRLRVE
ncbi:MAG: O-antigen ligase family protein [Chloroflexi bacterium]|nr:O-antigen ligase family protein [Chloroflexota bacterium]